MNNEQMTPIFRGSFARKGKTYRRGKQCPEYARHTGEVSDKSGWNADYVAIVVTEVKFKRLIYAPKVVTEHFKNCWSCEVAHGN